MNRRWIRQGEWVERTIRDQHLLIPIARSEADLEGFYTLNETAHRIWSLAAEGRSEEEITAALVDEYEIEPAAAAADVRRALEEFVTIGALKESA